MTWPCKKRGKKRACEIQLSFGFAFGELKRISCYLIDYEIMQAFLKQL